VLLFPLRAKIHFIPPFSVLGTPKIEDVLPGVCVQWEGIKVAFFLGFLSCGLAVLVATSHVVACRLYPLVSSLSTKALKWYK
jgi:hypothetical protein